MSRLNPAELFGSVLMARLGDAAADLRRASDDLYAIAARVPIDIGTTPGISERPISATDLAVEALRELHRHQPHLSAIVAAAADYDRHVQPAPSATEGDQKP